LQYTYPEAVGATQALNLRIDSLITNALQQKAMPSCQVLVAVKGKVFLHKNYGFHTFDSLQATQWNSLYDLASVTKILAGTLAIMKLHENRQFNLDKTLATTFPLLKKTDKAAIIWRDLLAHQARVPAGIPFWQFTLDKRGKLDNKLYARNRTAQFSWQVADSLFTKPSVQNIYLKAFKNAVLLPQKQYLYSDLPFVLTALAVSQQTKLRLDEYLYRNFYKSLGTNFLVFNPLQIYKKEMIVPTEYDSTFRQQLVHGTVHDESAALLGGVSGNAGLFGNANDVAKILQLFLQNGEYGGKNYLQSATLHEFTRCQFCWEQTGNFRGLGFNRQIFTPNPNSHAAVSATEQSFGHTGFTGTYTWVDKEYDLIYVFLSNRVYPTRKNQKLMELNLRTQILEEVYQALKQQ
jgi:CubicO group peptidase (beta-lactamase class C family)